MPFIKDEQTEKQESAYLKYEAENTLILRSNLYKIPFHYLNSVRKSVACHGDMCDYCDAGFRKTAEYNYIVNLNGQEGALNVKPSVFFNIQGIAKAKKAEPRAFQWLIIKKGEGKETEYTTSKDETLPKEDQEKITSDLEKQNEKLAKLMAGKERMLEENYATYLDQVDAQKAKNEEEKSNALENGASPEDFPTESRSVEEDENGEPIPF